MKKCYLLIALFALVLVGPIAASTKAVSFSVVANATQTEMDYLRQIAVLESTNALEKKYYETVTVSYQVFQYTLVYKSTSATGTEVDHTALVMFPYALGSFDTLVYNHGDMYLDADVPSKTKICSYQHYNVLSFSPTANPPHCNFMTSHAARASFWASQGYIVIMPDFTGMGDSATTRTKIPPAYQAGLYKDAVINALDALYSLSENDFPIAKTGRLLVGGFDEGGYATMAVQKALDTGSAPHGLRMVAAFPQTFPYKFSEYAKEAVSRFANTTTFVSTSENWRALRLLLARFGSNGYNESKVLDTSNANVQLIRQRLKDRRIPLTRADAVRIGTDPTTLPDVFESANAKDYFKDDAMYQKMLSKEWPTDLEAGVITGSELAVDWDPKAFTYLCSVEGDLEVPDKHSAKAYEDFSKKSRNVVWDRVMGATEDLHRDAAAQCFLVMSTLLKDTDWKAVENTVVNGPPKDKEPTINEVFPLWLLVMTIVVILSVIMVAIRIVTKKGPCHFWVGCLTSCEGTPSGILMSAYFKILFAITIAGLMASGGTITIDSNFAGYMTADSELKAEEDMFKTAVAFQKETAAVKTTKRALAENGRRLAKKVQHVGPLWTMDIFYASKNPDAKFGIFYEAALEEIKAFEQKLMAFPGFKEFCLQQVFNPGQQCDLPMSVINVMYGESQVVGNVTVSKFDGKGKLQNIETALKALAAKGVFWYTDANFGPTNLTSEFIRSQFKGGLPLKGYGSVNNLRKEQDTKHHAFLKTLYNDFFMVEAPKLKHVIATWYEPWFLRDYEVEVQLWHDAKYSAGSFMFVFICALSHFVNYGLTYVSMLSIVLSFPMAYFVFYVIAGVEKMMLLNFVSLFLIMGIGADDVFVMYDTFQQSKAVLGDKSTLKARMEWTYKDAGGAMLITTVTTVGSFFSNCLSTVRVVKEFGLFMGTVVAMNFLNVMVVFPAALILFDINGPSFLKAGHIALIWDDALCMKCIGNKCPACYGKCLGWFYSTAFQDIVWTVILLLGCAYYAATGLIPLSIFWFIFSLPGIRRLYMDVKALKENRENDPKPLKKVVPVNSDAPENDKNASRRAKRRWNKLQKRTRLRRLLKPKGRPSDEINVDKLPPTERFFYKQYSNCLKKFRFVIIAVGFAGAFFSGFMATQTVKTASGPPIVFLPQHNLGRVEHLLRTAFSATSPEDLAEAAEAFNPNTEKVETACPTKEGSTGLCSDEGSCEATKEGNECQCNDNMLGAACSYTKLSESKMVVDKSSLAYKFNGAGTQSFVFTITNEGDEKLSDVSVTYDNENAVKADSNVYEVLSITPTLDISVAKRDFAKGEVHPMIQSQIVNVTVKCKTSGEEDKWNKNFTLSVNVGSEAKKSIFVEVEKRSIVPSKEEVRLNDIDASAFLIGASVNKLVLDTNLVDDRDTAQLTIDSVIVSWTTETQRNGVKKYTYDGVEFSPGQQRTIKFVVTRTSDSGTIQKTRNKTYTVTRDSYKKPTPPGCSGALAESSGTVKITVTTSGTGGGNLKNVKCVSEEDSSKEGTVTSFSNNQAVITVENLTPTQAYSFKCTAENQGNITSHYCEEATEPVIANIVAPTITGVPEVVKGNTKVTIKSVPHSLGGGIVDSITCRTNDGASEVTGPNFPLDITGLNLDSVSYKINCTLTDKNDLSTTSGYSRLLSPNQPDPPTFNAVSGNKVINVTNLAVANNNGISQFDCVLRVDGSETKTTTAASSPTISFSNLENGKEYTVGCTATSSAGESNSKAHGLPLTPATIPSKIMSINVTDLYDGAGTLSVQTPDSDGLGGTTAFEKITCVTTPATSTFVINIPEDSSSTIYTTAVSGFTNNVDYTIACHATNTEGLNGESKSASRRRLLESAGFNHGRTLFRSYGPPTWDNKVILVRDNSAGNQLALRANFTAVADNGGKLITAYSCDLFESETNVKVESFEPADANKTKFTRLFTNLVQGTNYAVNCSAENEKGTSKCNNNQCKSNAVQSGKLPSGSPTLSTSTTAKGSVRVAVIFNATSNGGGLPVAAYKCKSNASAEYTSQPSNPVFDFPGLDPTISYTFRCRVSNAEGDGPESNDSDPVQPASTPDGPGFAQLNRQNTACKITLEAPSDNGGVPIDNCKCDDGAGNSASSLAGSPYIVTVPSLTNEQEYTFTCKCANQYNTSAYGTGAQSSRTCVPKAIAAPDKPSSIDADADNQKILVKGLTVAKELGDGDITGFNCTVGSVSKTVSMVVNEGEKRVTFPSALSFNSLTNGNDYTVTCVSKNIKGDSAASDPVTKTPTTAPGNLTSMTVVAGRNQVTITLTDGLTGGSPIQKYTCELYDKAGIKSTVSSDKETPNFTEAGLTNGDNYQIACRAENTAAGPYTARVSFVPLGEPDPPAAITANSDTNGTIVVQSITAPTDTGGLNITNFTCKAKRNGNVDAEMTVALAPITFHDLKNGEDYSVECFCSNSKGASLTKTSSSVRVARVPDQVKFITSGALLQTSVTKVNVNTEELGSTTGYFNGGDSAAETYSCFGSVFGSNGALQTSKVENSNTHQMTLLFANSMLPGSTLTVYCRAGNSRGYGQNSTSASLAIVGLPQAPATVTVRPGNAKVDVSTNFLQDNSVFVITTITCTLSNGTFQSSPQLKSVQISDTTISHSFSDVPNGYDYTATCFSSWTGRHAPHIGSKPTGNTGTSESGLVQPGLKSIVDLIFIGTSTVITKKAGLKSAMATALSLNPSALYVSSFQRMDASQFNASVDVMLKDISDFLAKKPIVDQFPSSGAAVWNSVDANGIKSSVYRMMSQDTELKGLKITDKDGITLNDFSGTEFTGSESVYSPSQIPLAVQINGNLNPITIIAEPTDAHDGLSRIEYTVSHKPNGFKTENEGGNIVTLNDTLSPKGTNVIVRIIPADSSAVEKIREYKITITRSSNGAACNNCNGKGQCNNFTGECTCNSGYDGPTCDVNCPNDCSGHGACDTTTTKKCICLETYAGDGCAQRACPACNTTGLQTDHIAKGCDESTWTCSCRDGYGGKYCNERTCFKNCHEQGECNSGVCTCYPGYEGEFCSVKQPRKVPLAYAVSVSIVFGIKRPDGENATVPVYDLDTNFENAEAMNFLASVCDDATAQSDLLVRDEQPCWVSAFRKAMPAFPVSPSLLPGFLEGFLRKATLYKSDIGTSGKHHTGKILWTTLTFKINVDASIGAANLVPHQKRWEDFTEKVKAKAPKIVGTVRMISSFWTKMETELGIITSTIASYITSNMICFVCVVIFTGDLLVSFYAMVSIILIVMTLVGFLFAVMGYTFGAIEAVGVTIFVGMSVDYGLHMAHGFHSAHSGNGEESKRFQKIRNALAHLGVSIVGGAITTAGAAVFLLFCRMYLFVQLGTMMFMNTLLALFFSLVFLASVMLVAGPTSNYFDIYALLPFIVSKIKGDKPNKVQPEPSKPSKPSKKEETGYV